MKIVLLLLEIFVICYMGCLFFYNRHAKQILTISLNTICIGLAFTLLSLVLSSPEVRFSLDRVLLIGGAVSVIIILDYILSFFVNIENEDESDNFYVYFTYDRDKNTLVNIEKENNIVWLRISSYFNGFVSHDKNSNNLIQVDADFFQDFMDFLIIRNLGFRYMGSWFIYFESLPLSGIESWGPKDYKMPIKTKEIKQEHIIGYKQNRLINRVRVSQGDEVIKVPDGTSISLEKGVETDLLSSGYADKNLESRTRRIAVKNSYCTINLETYFNGRLGGDFFKDIKNEVVTPDVGKCKIDVYVFKAKYRIKYNRFKMGTKKFIDYYKPWAKDLCSSFQHAFDIQAKAKNVTNEYRLRIRGIYS